MISTLMSSIIYDESYNEKILKYFKIEAEDPALNLLWNEI